jgi:hypothetical protein
MDYEFWPNGQATARQEDLKGPRIFPNPVKNRATLTLDPGIPAPVSVEIVDVHGRVVQRFSNRVLTGGNFAFSLDMSMYPVGIYYCKVLADKELHVISLVKIAD